MYNLSYIFASFILWFALLIYNIFQSPYGIWPWLLVHIYMWKILFHNCHPCMNLAFNFASWLDDMLQRLYKIAESPWGIESFHMTYTYQEHFNTAIHVLIRPIFYASLTLFAMIGNIIHCTRHANIAFQHYCRKSQAPVGALGCPLTTLVYVNNALSL